MRLCGSPSPSGYLKHIRPATSLKIRRHTHDAGDLTRDSVLKYIPFINAVLIGCVFVYISKKLYIFRVYMSSNQAELNYYQILGVPKTASKVQICQA